MRLSWQTFFNHKHYNGVYFVYGSVQLTFDFSIQLLRSIFQKNGGHVNRSGSRNIEIGLVIHKLSRFSQVQGERKRTLVMFLADVLLAFAFFLFIATKGSLFVNVNMCLQDTREYCMKMLFEP